MKCFWRRGPCSKQVRHGLAVPELFDDSGRDLIQFWDREDETPNEIMGIQARNHSVRTYAASGRFSNTGHWERGPGSANTMEGLRARMNRVSR